MAGELGNWSRDNNGLLIHPLIKGENAIQIHCPKCDYFQLIAKKGTSKRCKDCGYTRTVKEES